MLLEFGLCACFSVCFAYSRTLADNRMPRGRVRTKKQRQALAWLILANCAQVVPGGLLAVPLGELAHLDLFWQLVLSAVIGWIGVEKTMQHIESKIWRKIDGTDHAQMSGDDGDQLNPNALGDAPKEQ